MSFIRKVIRAVTPPIVFGGFQKLGRSLKPRPDSTDLHRRVVGGAWDEIGKLQFDFLLQHGLQPSHLLLDVGCGSLRGGIHFVRYLEDGHYYGITGSSGYSMRG